MARTVVGTRTATCFPDRTALNAARIATSVLPNPTSPLSRRSIGLLRSMSAFTSAVAWSWWGVSSKGKDASISFCQGLSGPKVYPLDIILDAYISSRSLATRSALLRARSRARIQAALPSWASSGSAPSAAMCFSTMRTCDTGMKRWSSPPYRISMHSVFPPSISSTLSPMYLPMPWFMCTMKSPGLKCEWSYVRDLLPAFGIWRGL